MQQRRNRPTLRPGYAAFTVAAITTTLIALLACNSKPSSKLSAEKTPNHYSSGQASDDPGINLNCVYDR
ncbi:MAG TPA: hypothetical protein VGC82_04105, partial [Rhodopila sp.]